MGLPPTVRRATGRSGEGPAFLRRDESNNYYSNIGKKQVRIIQGVEKIYSSIHTVDMNPDLSKSILLAVLHIVPIAARAMRRFALAAGGGGMELQGWAQVLGVQLLGTPPAASATPPEPVASACSFCPSPGC